MRDFRTEANSVAQEIADRRSLNSTGKGSTRNCREIEILMLQLAAFLFYDLEQSEVKESEILRELDIFQVKLVMADQESGFKTAATAIDGAAGLGATIASINLQIINAKSQHKAKNTPETEAALKKAKEYYGLGNYCLLL